MLGDPISVVGSPVRGTWDNGWTIYFLSWHKLVAGSATGDAVLASASGSQFVPGSTVAPSTASGPAARSRSPAWTRPELPEQQRGQDPGILAALLADAGRAQWSPESVRLVRLLRPGRGPLARLAGRHRGPLGLLVAVAVAVAVTIRRARHRRPAAHLLGRSRCAAASRDLADRAAGGRRGHVVVASDGAGSSATRPAGRPGPRAAPPAPAGQLDELALRGHLG